MFCPSHKRFQQVVPTREGSLTMTVDPTRANEMLDPRRGRLGAPHLVTLTPAGDLIIQVMRYNEHSYLLLVCSGLLVRIQFVLILFLLLFCADTVAVRRRASRRRSQALLFPRPHLPNLAPLPYWQWRR